MQRHLSSSLASSSGAHWSPSVTPPEGRLPPHSAPRTTLFSSHIHSLYPLYQFFRTDVPYGLFLGESVWGSSRKPVLRVTASAESAKQQIFVCTNKSCRRLGSLQVLEYFKCLAPPDVEIITTGCLGKCGSGPNIVITPVELQISHCNTAQHIARLLEKQCGATDAENNLKAFELQAKGSEAFVTGQTQAAEAFFSEAVSLNPSGGLHNILCSRSACRTALGDVEGALDDVREALKLKPNWSTALICQARAHEAAGDSLKALEVYGKAADIDSDFRRSKLYLRKRKELQVPANAP